MTYPKALNELIGTKFKIVTGYPGGNEITLALERGEVEGYCGWAIGSIKLARAAMAERRHHQGARAVHAVEAGLPNVPLASDLPPTKTGKQAIELLAGDSLLAWPLLAPPDLPAERVRELRTAFDAMMKDPELLAEANKQGLEIEPVRGEEMQSLVERLYTTPPEVVELVKRIVNGH